MIREARPADYDDLSALYAQVDALHAENLPFKFQRTEGPARSRDYVDSLIKSSRTGLFVAEVDGDIVGFVKVTIETAPDFALYVPQRYATVDDLVVDEKHRRQGIGQVLMDKVHAWAKEKGATSVQLVVYEFNQAAVDFYRSLGYETLRWRMRKPLQP